ncbi:MAG: hypothetical protein ACOCQR_03125 [bacterium]
MDYMEKYVALKSLTRVVEIDLLENRGFYVELPLVRTYHPNGKLKEVFAGYYNSPNEALDAMYNVIINNNFVFINTEKSLTLKYVFNKEENAFMKKLKEGVS